MHLDVAQVEERDDATSPYPGTVSSRGHRHRKSQGSLASHSREDLSPLPTGDSMRSAKNRSIDRYISSLEEANQEAEQLRAENRSRSRPRTGGRSPSRNRDEVRVIKPAKRSPSSPIPMTSDDAQQYRNSNNADNELTSPVDSRSGRARISPRHTSRPRASSRSERKEASPERPRSRNTAAPRASSKARSRHESPERGDRGRHQHKRISSGARSPSSPSPMEAYNEETFNPEPRRYRQRSSSGIASVCFLDEVLLASAAVYRPATALRW